MDNTVLINDIKIPIGWVCTYRHIQYLLVKYGVDVLKGCDNVCSTNNKNIIQLWNLFKNAAYVYYQEDVTEATNIYNFIVDSLKSFDDVDVGTSEIKVEDSTINVRCVDGTYEIVGIETTYQFEYNNFNPNIEDIGIGDRYRVGIVSNEILTIGNKTVTNNLVYDFILENPADAIWVEYDSRTNSIIVRENKGEVRTANFSFVQQSSGLVLNGTITQEVSTYYYEYTINITPENITLPAEGGSAFFVIESYKELKDEEGNVVGDKINVPYSAVSSTDAFYINDNTINADANTGDIRKGAIIINRPEIGISGNKSITITQDSLNKEIHYTIRAFADNNVIDSEGKTQVVVTVESYKETYNGGVAQGDITPVNYTITSDLGILKPVSGLVNTFYMPANGGTSSRTDSLIIKQNESNKTQTIDIVQEGSVQTFVDVFEAVQSSLNVSSNGGVIIAEINSYRQFYVNGKPTTKNALSFTGEVTVGNDFISIDESLPNSVTVSSNTTDVERYGKIIYTQTDSNKEIEVRIEQDIATVEYEYTLSLVTAGSNIVELDAVPSDKIVNINSYKQKKINGVPTGDVEQVDIKTSNITGDNYDGIVGINANNQGLNHNVYIKSAVNPDDASNSQNRVIHFDVTQIIVGTSEKKISFTITKKPSLYEYTYNLTVGEHDIPVKNYAPNTTYSFGKVIAKRITTRNKEWYEEKEANYSVETVAEWITVAGVNHDTFTVAENITSKIRTAIIKVFIPEAEEDDGTNETLNEINVTQEAVVLTDKRIPFGDAAGIELTPDARTGEYHYTLYHIYYRNGYELNRVDETEDAVIQNHTVGCNPGVNGDADCEYDWDVYTHFTQHYISFTYRGDDHGASFDVHVYFSDYWSGYNGYISAWYENATRIATTDEKYDELYKDFYHNIPNCYKCLYVDLMKIFINAYGDTYKLRKAIYHLNLFQSAVAAYFFNMKKECAIFVQCIINFINKYFNDNNIARAYDFTIDDNNHIFITISDCNKDADVELLLETENGHLFEIDSSEDKTLIDFEINNNNLIAISHDSKQERPWESDCNCR